VGRKIPLEDIKKDPILFYGISPRIRADKLLDDFNKMDSYYLNPWYKRIFTKIFWKKLLKLPI